MPPLGNDTSTQATANPVNLPTNLSASPVSTPVSLPQPPPASATPPTSTGGISDSISKAQKMGASSDQILQEIQKQNPTKADTFSKARSMGASSDQIIQEILKQNNGATQLPPPPQQTGIIPGIVNNFATNINKDLGQRGSDFAHSITDAPQRADQIGVVPALAETGLRAAGAAAGGIVDFATDAVKAITPSPVKDWLHGVISRFAQQDATGPQLISHIANAWNGFSADHPEIVKDAGAVMNIIGAITGFKGATAVGEKLPAIVQGTKDTLGNAVTGAKNLVTKSPETIAANKTNSVWKMIQPDLSVTEQATARKVPGQITQEGLLKTTTLNPIGRNADMLTASQPYLADVKTAADAVPKLQDGIIQEATKLRAGLDQSKAIWNQNELKGVINGIEKPHLLSGDLEKSFDKTLKVVLDQSANADKKLSGLLDVRQNFDQVVSKQYPNLYNSDTMTPIKTAVTDTRRAINDLIESKLPEGQTADGIPFKQSLKNQSLLYDAVDNAATNAAKATKIGSNVLTRTESAIRKHPIVTGIGAYEAVKHIANPMSGL